MGGAGMSAFEELKLTQQRKDFAEAAAGAQAYANLRPVLDAYGSILTLVSTSEIDQIKAAQLEAAGEALERAAAASNDASLQEQATSIGKLTAKLTAAVGKGDISASALAATKLASELTDLTYQWTASEKPMEAYRVGPSLRPSDGSLPEGAGFKDKRSI